ncbi:S24 family peptidase [Pokkaliibacter sp. CJK22405]|uniref:S24 family peptidase n=1 Tax=Pokkaliibacter sp. CJK22405 TaxID=3384615 RepID=UPI0039852D61
MNAQQPQDITLVGRSGFFRNMGLALHYGETREQLPKGDGSSQDQPLDLNELCVRHPTATFFLRASGEAFQGSGISSGDIMVVDRALNPQHGDMVVVKLDGEFMVRKLACQTALRLLPLNSRSLPIQVTESMDIELFGVIAHVIRSMRAA